MRREIAFFERSLGLPSSDTYPRRAGQMRTDETITSHRERLGRMTAKERSLLEAQQTNLRRGR